MTRHCCYQDPTKDYDDPDVMRCDGCLVQGCEWCVYTMNNGDRLCLDCLEKKRDE